MYCAVVARTEAGGPRRAPFLWGCGPRGADGSIRELRTCRLTEEHPDMSLTLLTIKTTRDYKSPFLQQQSQHLSWAALGLGWRR